MAVSPVLLVVIAAVAIGLTIRSARRGLGDRNTLAAHHRALDTLADMAARRNPVTSPVADVRSPPVPAPERPRQRWRPSGARHPPVHRRRAVPPAVVAAVGATVATALALAVAVAVLDRPHHPAPAVRRAVAPTAAPVITPPTTRLTTAPVVFGSGDSQGARFRVSQTGADIELVPISSCWVQIRTAGPTGPLVFTGTLRSGDRRRLPAGQPVWLRMGNPPGMSVEVNGTPLAFSAPSGAQPFNLVFEPAA